MMRLLAIEGADNGILVNTISPNGYTRCTRPRDPGWLKATERHMPVEAVCSDRGWQATVVRRRTASTSGAGTIQRIAIVMGPGFYNPDLTPESIAENYAKVESIEGFSSQVRSSSGNGVRNDTCNRRGSCLSIHLVSGPGGHDDQPTA